MSRDPLQALLRMRQSAVDDARTAIADAYQAEQEAIETVRELTKTLEREMREASSLTAGDEAVETFARWLPVGRRRIAEAHARQRAATAELDQVRAVLVLASAAVRSVEIVMEKKREEKIAVMKRREQAELDEFAAKPGNIRQ